MTLARRFLAALISLAIVILSPGFRCYDAAAATFRSGKADVSSGRSLIDQRSAPARAQPDELDLGNESVALDLRVDPQLDVPGVRPLELAAEMAVPEQAIATRAANLSTSPNAKRAQIEQAALPQLLAGADAVSSRSALAVRSSWLKRLFSGEREKTGGVADAVDLASEASSSRFDLKVASSEHASQSRSIDRLTDLAVAHPTAPRWTRIARAWTPAVAAIGLGAVVGAILLPDVFSWLAPSAAHAAGLATTGASAAHGFSWTAAGTSVAMAGMVAAGRTSRGSSSAGYKRGQEKFNLRSFPIGKIFGLLKPYKKIMAIASGVMTLQALVQLILPKLFSQMTELFIGKATMSPLYAWLFSHVASIPGAAALFSLLPADPWMASLALIFVSTAFVGVGLFYIMKKVSWLITYVGSIQMRDLSVKLYSRILHLPMNLFQKYRDGELTAVIDTNLYDLRLGATQLVTSSIQNGVLFLLTCYFMFQLHWIVASISIAVFAVALGGPSEMFRRQRSIVYDDFYAAKRQLTGEAQEKISNIRVAKAYGQEQAEADKYQTIAEDVFMDKGMRIAKVSALQFATDEILTWLALFIVAAVGGYYVHIGQLTVGDFSSLVLYAYFLKNSFGALMKNYKSLGDTQGAARLVFELWDALSEPYHEDRSKLDRVKGDIQIKNLHFAYTRPIEGENHEELVDGTLVMNGVNLHIPAGTSLAIVGKSGSGKTTLSDIIMRFLKPTQMATMTLADGSKLTVPLLKAHAMKGELDEQLKSIREKKTKNEAEEKKKSETIAKLEAKIKNVEGAKIESLPVGTVSVDGKDISELNLVGYRNQFGLVPQEPAIFSGTIKDNIIYGLRDATMEQIEQATKRAHAYDFIREMDPVGKSFEKGLATVVGQRGMRLSTGQKQRLMIARAFLVNPPILIMDEPTASLDAESEEAVVKAMENIMAGRTTIVVAHRLSTIQRAQKVIFLGSTGADKGKILEEGSIEELLKIPNGHFRGYWETQSLKEQVEQREKQDKTDKK